MFSKCYGIIRFLLAKVILTNLSDEENLMLTNLYKLQPILWNPSHSQTPVKNDKFWHEIAKELGKEVNKCTKAVACSGLFYGRV